MLNKEQKQTVIDGLKGDIDKAQGLFLTNLIGITANDSVRIRKEVREAGGKVVITRNTLFGKAAEGTYAENALKELKGTNAIAFAFEDAAAVAKVLKEAGKDLELIDLKAGFLEQKELTKEQVVELANLPGRDQMLGTLLATFMAPVSAFARVMHAIKEQKEEGATAS